MSLKKNRGFFSVLLLAASILFGGNASGSTSNEPTDNDEATVSRQKDLLHFDNDGKGIGDVLPFYWNGEYHVFYQAPPPSGVDYVSWGHSVSTDLVNWEILPYAILAGTPEEPDGHGAYSGSVVENNGIFHAYYTGHNPANLEQGPESTLHATSRNLITWTKHPEDIIEADGIHYRSIKQRPIEQQKEAWPESTPGRERFRDPNVFWNEDEGQWWMVLSAIDADTRLNVQGLATSKDLITWKQEKHLLDLPASDCPDVFKIGDWWYCIAHITYHRARTPRGPYEKYGDGFMETPFLSVPQEMFDGKRHLLAGHIIALQGERDSGAAGFSGPGIRSMFREVYADEDGGLCMRPVKEFIDLYDEVVVDLASDPKPDVLYGKCDYRNGELACNPTHHYGRTHLSFDTPASYMMKCSIRLFREGATLTVGFREQDGNAQAPYKLHIRPRSNEIEIAGPELAFHRECKIDVYKPITVQAFVQDDFIECFVNDAYAFTFRAYDFPTGKLSFDVTNGDITLQELQVMVIKQ